MSHRRASGDSTCVLRAYQAPQMDPNVHTHTIRHPVHMLEYQLTTINNTVQYTVAVSLSLCID